MRQTNDVVEAATGQRPRVMRPPEGAITPELAATIGMPQILWSVDTQDWLHRNTETTIQNVLTQAGPGSIVLMHDLHASTVDAAPRIIDELHTMGYSLVTIDELFGHQVLGAQIYY